MRLESEHIGQRSKSVGGDSLKLHRFHLQPNPAAKSHLLCRFVWSRRCLLRVQLSGGRDAASGINAEKAHQSPEAKSTDASATPGFAVKTQSAPLYAPEQVEMQACLLWQVPSL